MRIKSILPILCTSAVTIFSGCSSSTSKSDKVLRTLHNDSRMTEILKDSLSVNTSDIKKIVDYNKLLKKYKHKVDNYIIVDKKNCTAVVYTPDGDTLNLSEVGLGKTIGDKRCGEVDKKGGVDNNNYTAPGEFIISREGAKSGSYDARIYGQKLLYLAGDNVAAKCKKNAVIALHQIPLTPRGQLRKYVFNNDSKKDNRVSQGCINFLPDEFDRMRKYIKGIGTKVYVLPEEEGNNLRLESQKNGTYKFFQTKYRYEYMEKSKDSTEVLQKK